MGGYWSLLGPVTELLQYEPICESFSPNTLNKLPIENRASPRTVVPGSGQEPRRPLGALRKGWHDATYDKRFAHGMNAQS
jgi:hypothetical protein